MISIVVVTHARIGHEMVDATKRIIPDVNHVAAVSVDMDESTKKTHDRIAEVMKSLEPNDGTLLLTDMFGGTPSNVCLSFLEKDRVEVISGVNLPMLIKLANMRDCTSLSEMVQFIQRYGQRNIVVASQVLEGNVVGL